MFYNMPFEALEQFPKIMGFIGGYFEFEWVNTYSILLFKLRLSFQKHKV